MVYDEFFTDGDKPYSENLNDSLLLLDAFDVTVPCELPDMFSNGQFSNTVDAPRKCGVGIVTLKSVASGVTIGTDSISGTGAVVFRVYPNFNSFYKWQSIILDKTGTVSISFKKTDGTSISATVGSDGTISEASALKVLQEIDVVLTLTSATISGILINFVNNQTSHTRVNAQLEADQLIHVNGTVSENDDKAVSGDTVYNAIDSLSDTVDGKLDLKEDLSNKVSTLNTSTTNYPTCKAVKDKLDLKSDTGHTHTISNVTSLQSTLNDKLDFDDLLDLVYPVGAIYIDASSSHSTCPIQTLLGGTWERIQGRFLLASEDDQGVGTTGGSADAIVVEHTHTQNPHNHKPYDSTSFVETDATTVSTGSTKRVATSNTNGNFYWQSNQSSEPSITRHTVTANTTATNQNTGESGTGKNMPPYLRVNIWKRTE